MAQRYTKDMVNMHSDRGPEHPAINVKVYKVGIHDDEIAEHFKCSLAQAEKAGQYWFESAQSTFWEEATEQARESRFCPRCQKVIG